MALDLTALFRTPNCKSLKTCETTGVYHATDNPGGYGAPNAVMGDFDSATLSVELSNGTILGPIDVYNEGTLFPSELGSEFTLDSDALGGDLVDGTTTVEIIMTGPNDAYIKRRIVFFITCGVKCCISKLATKIDANDKCCTSGASKAFNQAMDMYAQIRYLSDECCNFSKATAILEELQLLCENNQCKDC